MAFAITAAAADNLVPGRAIQRKHLVTLVYGRFLLQVLHTQQKTTGGMDTTGRLDIAVHIQRHIRLSNAVDFYIAGPGKGNRW